MSRKALTKRCEKSRAQYRQILVNALCNKGLTPSHANLGAELVIEAGRQNNEMLTRSANTYRLMLGMEAR
jgi:hypothetical protein